MNLASPYLVRVPEQGSRLGLRTGFRTGSGVYSISVLLVGSPSEAVADVSRTYRKIGSDTLRNTKHNMNVSALLDYDYWTGINQSCVVRSEESWKREHYVLFTRPAILLYTVPKILALEILKKKNIYAGECGPLFGKLVQVIDEF